MKGQQLPGAYSFLGFITGTQETSQTTKTYFKPLLASSLLTSLAKTSRVAMSYKIT